MTIETTLTFIPVLDRAHSCRGCIGDQSTEVCHALPDCMGLGPDGMEMVPGSKGNGVVWMLKVEA